MTFIEKNKDYFNQPFFKNDVSYKSGSTLQNIDTSQKPRQGCREIFSFAGGIASLANILFF